MTLPGFPSRIVLWPWSVTPGIADSRTFTFLDSEGGDYDPGVVTAKAKDGAIPATVTGTGNTRTVTWSAEQTAAIPATQWRLNFDGEDHLGGRIGISQPEEDPNLSNDWTIQLPGDGDGDGLTITVDGTGMRAAATHRIPMVAGWNPTSLVPGIYAAGRVFLFGCAVADITPAPATPFQVIVEAAFAPGTPSDPSADDIPSEDAWFTVQDLENADIYGALLIPLDYLVAPYEAHLPPEFEGSYPFGQPIWYRGRSIDADGFRTVFNMFMPDGIPADPEAFPMVVFADGHKTTVTIDAPADDTSAGDPSEVTVDYEAIGTGLAPAARNVDARMAALVARIEALEIP